MLGYFLIFTGLALISYGIVLLQKEKEQTEVARAQPSTDSIPAFDRILKHHDQDQDHLQKLREMISMAAVDGIITPNEEIRIAQKARELSISSEDVETMLAEELQNVGIKPEVKLIDKLKEKGDQFEIYTLSKFNKKNFQLLFWAGDKHVSGNRALSNSDPDLKFLYKSASVEQEFAVECK